MKERKRKKKKKKLTGILGFIVPLLRLLDPVVVPRNDTHSHRAPLPCFSFSLLLLLLLLLLRGHHALPPHLPDALRDRALGPLDDGVLVAADAVRAQVPHRGEAEGEVERGEEHVDPERRPAVLAGQLPQALREG